MIKIHYNVVQWGDMLIFVCTPVWARHINIILQEVSMTDLQPHNKNADKKHLRKRQNIPLIIYILAILAAIICSIFIKLECSNKSTTPPHNLSSTQQSQQDTNNK